MRAATTVWPAVLTAVACAHAGPEDTLDAYARALEAGDAEAVYALSDPETQATLDPADLARFMAKNPATVRRAATALRDRHEVGRVTVRSSRGDVFELVRVDGEWRVAEGPLPVPRLDTPEHALATFFFAARGHLSLLRRTMPASDRARFASDARLGAHLHAEQPRIEAAREALEPLRPGMARIEGELAEIPWGEGRAVRLAREDGAWRVVDLE